MADPRGFLKHTERELPARRPVSVRILDWNEVYEERDGETVRRQASRCMDCGVPFCHKGCPLGNLIPEWNDLVYRGADRAASDRLHATNNFPEFTGRLCPAPCESACVLGISQPAVTIKQVEVSIIDTAFENGWVDPVPPERLTGKTVAVVGSGPAGLAAAQQLTRAGHTVAVFERDEKIGGLLRFGIPDFKLEKRHIDRRIEQMQFEGTRFRPGIEIGKDLSWAELRRRYDAVIIATGAQQPRDLAVPGRDARGVHFAMEYLVQANRELAGGVPAAINAKGKHVVVLGGGDTGADCIGTAHRQGAASVTTLAIGKQPPNERPASAPWPMHPVLFEMASAHEEGGMREFLASTVEYVKDSKGALTGLRVAETGFIDGKRVPIPGTERDIKADLVFLALGFTGTEENGAVAELGVELNHKSCYSRDSRYATSEPGVFVAGDAGRGQSLIVWAIAEGRAAAAEVDTFLGGHAHLPSPIEPSDKAISVS